MKPAKEHFSMQLLMNSINVLTLLERKESFGMRITIGARFSVDVVLSPFVDSIFDDTIVGLVKDEDINFIFPFTRLKK